MGEPPSGETTIAVEWGLAALALTFVLLRIWVRVVKLRSRLLLADYLVLAGWVVEAAVGGCDTVLYLGNGMRTGVDITKIVFSKELLQWSFASGTLYCFGVLLPRFSIAAFYSTLFLEGTGLRKALYAVTVYMVLCTLGILAMLVSYCRPISTNWSTGPDSCSVIASSTPFTIFCALVMGCDVALFVLPFFLLRTLTLRRSQQFALVAVFLVGFITIAVSIARYTAIKLAKDINTACIWSAAEFACSIIVVCLPNLRVFIHGAVSVFRNTDDDRGTSNTPSYKKKKAFPFSDLFSSHDRDSNLRENRSTISTRFSTIVDQFVNRQSDVPSFHPRSYDDSPIISPSNKDVSDLSRGESGHSFNNIELSNIDEPLPGRRPSELTIYKTNDVQFDVHIHNPNGENSCERRGGANDARNKPPPCATVEYVPGGKTPFETKVWV